MIENLHHRWLLNYEAYNDVVLAGQGTTEFLVRSGKGATALISLGFLLTSLWLIAIHFVISPISSSAAGIRED